MGGAFPTPLGLHLSSTESLKNTSRANFMATVLILLSVSIQRYDHLASSMGMRALLSMSSASNSCSPFAGGIGISHCFGAEPWLVGWIVCYNAPEGAEPWLVGWDVGCNALEGAGSWLVGWIVCYNAPEGPEPLLVGWDVHCNAPEGAEPWLEDVKSG